MYVSYDTEFVTVNIVQRPGRTDKRSEETSPQAAPCSANTGARASPRHETELRGKGVKEASGPGHRQATLC